MDETVTETTPDQKVKLKKNYLSKLDLVKEAVVDELKRMNSKKSKALVGLVSFSVGVSLIGDCQNLAVELN